MPISGAELVARAKELLAAHDVYAQGCSGFVCAVLSIPFREANDLVGAGAPSVGRGPQYALTPGDIAGWRSPSGSGHVAVYVGEQPDAVFIDVPRPGDRPRAKNGYYNHEMFKAPL